MQYISCRLEQVLCREKNQQTDILTPPKPQKRKKIYLLIEKISQHKQFFIAPK